MNSLPPVNPYIAGSPVTGTEMFYGRDDVFSFIRRNLIGRHRDTPVVLYGQRRTGKTSVLYQLHRHLGPGYRCILIDLHGLDLTGMGNFLLGIANSISLGLRHEHQLIVPVPDDDVFLANPRSVFETVFLDAVWSALEKDHLVLMMDEVVRLDEEVRAGRLEREVFDYLRHLMQHHVRLNFVFSLGSGLEEMRKDYAFLFSVSLYRRISFLEPPAARDLITRPVRDHYQVAPQAVTKILRITSGHPYYTQLVCHCLFDLWSRSEKPTLTEADVDAVLADAIELGSANLTYVWEDSTPGEQALMAGMADAMDGESGSVTLSQAQEAWQAVGVTLPDREAARALHSLTSREVVVGKRAYSFTVDLQRLWLDQHRRLEWVKEELAETAEGWNRAAEVLPADSVSVAGAAAAKRGELSAGRKITRHRRYLLAIAAAAVVLAGYLAAAAAVHVWPLSPTPTRSPGQVLPKSSPGQVLPQSLVQLLPGDLSNDEHECQAASPLSLWSAPGLTLTVHCTDPGLPGGNVYVFSLDSVANFQKAWQNFNHWWGFSSARAGTTCPPKGITGQGIVSQKSSLLLQADHPVLECGTMKFGPNKVPAYAGDYPTNDAFVIAEGAPGSSFSALTSWLSNPTPTPVHVAVGIAPLTQLLPADIDDPAIQCHAQTPPFNWAMPGLVQALTCDDPGLPGGYVYAYQVKTYADYQTTWANYNKWWSFDFSSAGANCPPGNSSSDEGTTAWYDNFFPTRDGQVLECEWVGTGSTLNEPAYTWTFPTENAFIVGQGAANTTFSALDTWWTNNASPLNKPSPAPSPSP